MDVTTNSPGCCCMIEKGETFASCVYDLPLIRYLRKRSPSQACSTPPKNATRIPDRPRRRALELELSDIACAKMFSSVKRNDSRCFRHVQPYRSRQGIRNGLFAARHVGYTIDSDQVWTYRLERIRRDVQPPVVVRHNERLLVDFTCCQVFDGQLDTERRSSRESDQAI